MYILTDNISHDCCFIGKISYTSTLIVLDHLIMTRGTAAYFGNCQEKPVPPSIGIFRMGQKLKCLEVGQSLPTSERFCIIRSEPRFRILVKD
jgi:hypothetical protein